MNAAALPLPVKPAVQRMRIEDVDNKTARKLIAQDVVNALDTRFMIAIGGSYVEVPYDNGIHEFLTARDPLDGFDTLEPFDGYSSASAQEVVERLPVCGVCAIGSLLVASVRRFNAVSVEDLGQVKQNDRRRAMDYLRKFFSDAELALMEACHEGILYYEGMIEDESPRIVRKSNYMGFHNSYSTPDDRLRAIMRNILDNDGKFVIGERVVDEGGEDENEASPDSDDSDVEDDEDYEDYDDSDVEDDEDDEDPDSE